MPTANSDWIPGPAPRSPRTRRRLGRSLLLVLVVLVAPVAGCRTWDAIEARRFWRAIDDLDARGERLEPAALGPQTAEQRTAAGLYADALRRVTAVDRAATQKMAEAIDEMAAAPDPARHPRLPELNAFVQQHAEALEGLDRAALDGNGADPAQMGRLRGYETTLESVNAVRIALRVFEGKPDEAAGALLTTLRARRAFPLSFGRWWMPRTGHSLQLVLAGAPPSDALLTALADEYARWDALQDLVLYLEEERAGFLASVMPEEFGGTPVVRRASPLESILAIATRPLRTRGLRRELDDFERAIERARAPWPARLDAARAALGESRAGQRRGRRSLVARVTSPWIPGAGSYAFANATTRMAGYLVQARAGAAAVAVVRHRVARGGRWPRTLAELVPAYLPAVPVDPYSGQEMRYTQSADGFTVYSVWSNRRDDGGTWETMSDVHPFRRGEPNDYGVAVRRQAGSASR